MKMQIQTTDEAGSVVETVKSDDVLLKELEERIRVLEANPPEDQDESLITSSIGTAIVRGKVGEEERAEYVTELYDQGREPFKGAGTGFYAGGRYYRMSDEGKDWRSLRLKKRAVPVKDEESREHAAECSGMACEAMGHSSDCAVASGPVEVDGRDVRTETLPGVDLERAPSSDKPPRPTLEVAIERYGNLTKEVDAFLIRLDSWLVPGSEATQEAFDGMVQDAVDAWEQLGGVLKYMQANGTVVKVTSRSRRDAWMRPGAEVALAPASLKAAGQFYSADVLENLTIKAAGDTHVFLVSGDRDIGAYPKSQVEKRVKRTRVRRKAVGQ